MKNRNFKSNTFFMTSIYNKVQDLDKELEVKGLEPYFEIVKDFPVEDGEIKWDYRCNYSLAEKMPVEIIEY